MVKPGDKVRYHNSLGIGAPDGIVDGDEGIALAETDEGVWNVEFPSSPFGYAEVSYGELEVIKASRPQVH